MNENDKLDKPEKKLEEGDLFSSLSKESEKKSSTPVIQETFTPENEQYQGFLEMMWEKVRPNTTSGGYQLIINGTKVPKTDFISSLIVEARMDFNGPRKYFKQEPKVLLMTQYAKAKFSEIKAGHPCDYFVRCKGFRRDKDRTKKNWISQGEMAELWDKWAEENFIYPGFTGYMVTGSLKKLGIVPITRNLNGKSTRGYYLFMDSNRPLLYKELLEIETLMVKYKSSTNNGKTWSMDIDAWRAKYGL